MLECGEWQDNLNFMADLVEEIESGQSWAIRRTSKNVLRCVTGLLVRLKSLDPVGEGLASSSENLVSQSRVRDW